MIFLMVPINSQNHQIHQSDNFLKNSFSRLLPEKFYQLLIVKHHLKKILFIIKIIKKRLALFYKPKK